jgi:hypothetical protein
MHFAYFRTIASQKRGQCVDPLPAGMGPSRERLGKSPQSDVCHILISAQTGEHNPPPQPAVRRYWPIRPDSSVVADEVKPLSLARLPHFVESREHAQMRQIMPHSGPSCAYSGAQTTCRSWPISASHDDSGIKPLQKTAC